MKKILTIFLGLLFAQGANAQTAPPSGVLSINTQQTVGNPKIYFASPHEYTEFLISGTIPTAITVHNGYVVNGVRTPRDRAFFEAHAEELRLTAVTAFNSQLEYIQEVTGGYYFNGDMHPTVEKYRNEIEARMFAVEIKFNLATGDAIFMLGEVGDFSGGKYVKHLSGDGKYYVWNPDTLGMFLMSRVSCFNNMTNKETFWIMDGKAVIQNNTFADNGTEGNDPPQGGGGTYLNGKRIDVGNGTTIINLYGGSNTAYGGAGGEGGSAISSSTSKVGNTTAKLIGAPNPNYNPNQVTTVAPSTTVIPVQTQTYPQMQVYPQMQMYPQYPQYQQYPQYLNQYPNQYYGYGRDNGYTALAAGINATGQIVSALLQPRNNGCFGNCTTGTWNNQNQDPGHFEYNSAILNTNTNSNTNTDSGLKFEYNAARPGH